MKKMSYKEKIDEVLKEINDGKNHFYVTVYQESGMYTILRWQRRISPVMTAKECYKTLETLRNVYQI